MTIQKNNKMGMHAASPGVTATTRQRAAEPIATINAHIIGLLIKDEHDENVYQTFNITVGSITSLDCVANICC
ncbi:MAG: hypothetical protein ABIN69_10920 [Aestuariivirga sp.]